MSYFKTLLVLQKDYTYRNLEKHIYQHTSNIKLHLHNLKGPKCKQNNEHDD